MESHLGCYYCIRIVEGRADWYSRALLMMMFVVIVEVNTEILEAGHAHHYCVNWICKSIYAFTHHHVKTSTLTTVIHWYCCF